MRRPVAIAFALLLLLTGAWLMYETRGTTLWFDEWIWALEYRDNSLGGFIAPHNGHPTLIPVAIYRLLFATVGIDHSAAAIHGAAPAPAEPPANPGPAPTVDAVAGDEAPPAEGCLEFAPAPAGPADPEPALELTVPVAGLVIKADAGDARVSGRRFDARFPEEPSGRFAAGGTGRLAFRPDLAPAPWHARVVPEEKVTVCGAPS